jgi:hypothetical protein
VVAVVVIVLVLVALAWFFLAGEQQVGYLRFGEPRGAAPIIELGTLLPPLLESFGGTSRDTSWTML